MTAERIAELRDRAIDDEDLVLLECLDAIAALQEKVRILVGDIYTRAPRDNYKEAK